jgi:flagellar L-ring protein precursor FlgH
MRRSFPENVFWLSAVFAGWMIGSGVPAYAQDSSLFNRGNSAYQLPLTAENASLFYKIPQPVDTLQLHDIVTVVVNINSRALSEGDAQNRKISKLDAHLQNWILLDGLRKVTPDPQSAGEPRIQAQLNSQFRTNADIETRNTLTFTVAAKISDVLPNGTLRVEAREFVNINSDLWERSLTGVIRREDVTPDNKVLSEDIADLQVFTRETGQVPDAYRRHWLHKLYDRYWPF